METPYGWAALALGALALAAFVTLARRLSRVEPDFRPVAAPAQAPPSETPPPREE